MRMEPAWRKRLGHWAAIAFMILVLGVVAHQARSLNWTEIAVALQGYRFSTLAMTLLFPVVGFSMFACYDLLAWQYTRGRVSPPQIMRIGFISYAFTLNIGTLIGGLAVRYRLYSRHGLEAAQVSQITALAIATNWSGYLLLAGSLLLFDPPVLPAAWDMNSEWLRIVGAAMLALVVAYLCLSALRHDRTWRFRRFEFTPLPIQRAALQLLLSSVSWTMMSLALNFLMPAHVPIESVMTGFFIASVAGLVVRVPAGLGVLEGVLVVLLLDFAPASAILAAILAYRAIYMLLPWSLAIALFAIEEWRVKRRGRGAERVLSAEY